MTGVEADLIAALSQALRHTEELLGSNPTELTREEVDSEVRSVQKRVYDYFISNSVSYDREELVWVLIYHQSTSTSGCICGWGVLGASHAEHVADVYEMTVRES